ncbi:hypothetical protein BU15DRAFT_89358 [Melanogaster broomeanus]|nr:hypothetical protein BU15DRAFT_89358 [Melanogaster broomeanus]
MTGTSPTTPVLVTGAGPSGLVAALALLRNGIPVRIITKETEHRIGQQLFHLLGVPQVEQTSSPVLPNRFYREGSLEPEKTFMVAPYTEPTPAIPYYNPRLIGQETLEAILRDRLAELSLQVEFGTELRTLEQDDNRVLAHVVKTENGVEVTDTIEASYLIGADGAKGVTRKQLGLSFVGETRENFHLLTGDICLDSNDIDREHFHFFGNPQGTYIILRPTDEVGPDGYQFILSPGKRYSTNQMLHDQDLLMRCISEVSTAKVQLKYLRWISDFRVHSLTGGQGLNSGVQDALNLAWKIALVYKERLPVIADMLNITTELLNRTVEMTNSTVETAYRRGPLLYMLGVNYRYSSIPGVLIAGDRAPDAPNLVKVGTSGEETRLFDIFQPYCHTVLIFSSDEGYVGAVLSAIPKFDKSVIRSVAIVAASGTLPSAAGAELVVRDQNAHAHSAYLVTDGENKVVVVRPDGAVGAIVHGAEARVSPLINVTVFLLYKSSATPGLITGTTVTVNAWSTG